MKKADKVYVIISRKNERELVLIYLDGCGRSILRRYGYQGRMICWTHRTRQGFSKLYPDHIRLCKEIRPPVQTFFSFLEKDIEDGRYAGVGKDREDLNVSMYAVKFRGIVMA